MKEMMLSYNLFKKGDFMEKLEELKILRKDVIEAKNKLTELNTKYNKYLDKKEHKKIKNFKAKEEQINDVITDISLRFDYEEASQDPFIIAYANICVGIKNLFNKEKIEKTKIEKENEEEIKSKYTKKKLVFLLFGCSIFIINPMLLRAGVASNIVNGIYIGGFASFIYNVIKVNALQKLEIKQTNELSNLLDNMENDVLYEQVLYARKKYHDKLKEYESKLNILSVSNNKMYTGYINDLNDEMLPCEEEAKTYIIKK